MIHTPAPINRAHPRNPHTSVICFCLHNSTWCDRLDPLGGFSKRDLLTQKEAGYMDAFPDPFSSVPLRPSKYKPS